MAHTAGSTQLTGEKLEETTLLETADFLRREISSRLDTKSRADLGQFMTPAVVARFMSSLFKTPKAGEVNLLDAGAGIGGLSAAFLEWYANQNMQGPITVAAYEIDDHLRNELAHTFAGYKVAINNLTTEILSLWAAVNRRTVPHLRQHRALQTTVAHSAIFTRLP